MEKNVIKRMVSIFLILLIASSAFLTACTVKDDEETVKKEESPIIDNIGPVIIEDKDGDGKIDVKPIVDSLTGIYSTVTETVKEAEAATKNGYNMNVEVKPGEQVISALEQVLSEKEMSFNLDWIKTIGVNLDVFSDEALTKFEASAVLNGTKILSFDGILDLLGEKVYMTFPELNSKYIYSAIDSQAVISSSDAIAGDFSGIYEAMPTEQEFSNIITRYVEIAAEHVKIPTTATESVGHGEVSCQVDTDTYVIGRQEAYEITKSVLTAIKSDKELESVLDRISKWSNEEDKKAYEGTGIVLEEIDLYEELCAAADDGLSEIEGIENTENDTVLKLVVYRQNDEQVGLKLVFVDGEYTAETYYYSVTSGKDTAFVMNLFDGVEIKGTGSKENDKISGSYVVENYGVEYLYLEIEDFDLAAWEKGYIDGTFVIEPSEYMMLDMFGVELSDSYVEIDMKYDDELSAEIALYINEIPLGSVKFESKKIPTESITLPENAVDTENTDELSAWLSEFSFSKVISNLRKASVPGEICDLLDFFLG